MKSLSRNSGFPRGAAALLLTALLGLFAGCSKQIPDVPKAKSDLLFDILTALEQKDHQTALSKIQRLRAIDKTNVFLSKMENIERNNCFIEDSRRLMSLGRYQEAERLLGDAIRQFGEEKDLIAAQKQVILLRQVTGVIAEMNAPENSGTLTASSLKLLELAKKQPDLKKMEIFAHKKLLKAKKMAEVEKQRALFGVYSEIEEQLKRGDDSSAAVLRAVLEAEAPGYPQNRIPFTR